MASITGPPEKPHKTISDFGPGNVAFWDDGYESDNESRFTVRSFVKPFVIKQWLHRGKLYRERRERVPSRFELFFDLVFVAIAHQLSEAAAEQASGAGAAQFILTFFPTWSLWSEFRAFVNASGTDDILQRVGVLYMMALLIGYTANASAISVFLPENVETHSSTGGESVVEHIARAVSSEEITPVASGERDPALVTAVVFYLLARGLRAGFLLMYAKALPQFRTALLFQLAHQVTGLVIVFPLLFVYSKPVIIALASLAMALDILLRYSVAMYRLVLPHKPIVEKEEEVSDSQVEAMAVEPCKGDKDPRNMCAFDKDMNIRSEGFIPALNIEHFLERTAAFVVIVLGEMVLVVVYRATGARAGFQNIYGSAICGLILAFNLCWLYFDAECSLRFLHAIRRHWFTGLTFTNLHFPLCASLILVSAAMSRMTQDPDNVSQPLRWYFGGGLSCAMFSMAAIGATHRGLDPTGTRRLGRRTQLGSRLAAAVIFACLPLSNLAPLELLGVAAGVTSFLVICETYGKLHRGEPLAKMNASEEAAAEAARNQHTDDVMEKGDDGETKGSARKED